VSVAASQRAKQSRSNVTSTSEISTARMQMIDSCSEPADIRQTIDNWLEYVPQQEPVAFLSPPAVTDSKTRSCLDEMLPIPDSGNPNNTVSEPDTLPEQECEDDAHAVEEPAVCQASGDNKTIVASTPSQPDTNTEQPLEDIANTVETEDPVEEPSLCLAADDTESTPLQPDNADTNTNKPVYRPLASLLSQAKGDTLMTISDISRLRNIHSRHPRNTDEPKTPVQSLFVADVPRDTKLTVEDIYIEAMTLDAEIRINRRHLDERGKAQLSKILQFCREALRAKLALGSVANRVHVRNRQQSEKSVPTRMRSFAKLTC